MNKSERLWVRYVLLELDSSFFSINQNFDFIISRRLFKLYFFGFTFRFRLLAYKAISTSVQISIFVRYLTLFISYLLIFIKNVVFVFSIKRFWSSLTILSNTIGFIILFVITIWTSNTWCSQKIWYFNTFCRGWTHLYLYCFRFVNFSLHYAHHIVCSLQRLENNCQHRLKWCEINLLCTILQIFSVYFQLLKFGNINRMVVYTIL